MKRHHDQSILVKEIRPIIFGIEDSLVSTLGVVVGIAASGAARRDVLVAGIILVVVEALSMGSGEYISSKSDEQVRTGANDHLPIQNGFVMWVSYMAAGGVPLFPFIFFPNSTAIPVAITVSALVIFSVGAWKARISLRKTGPLRSGLEMLSISVGAALIGFLLGQIASRIS